MVLFDADDDAAAAATATTAVKVLDDQDQC